MTLPRLHNLRQDIYGWIGFILLGLFSMLYSLFWSNFAQLKIQLFFLNFPIFVGEILLFICLLLTSAKLLQRRPLTVDEVSGRWILLYLIWFLSKAAYGYATYGPLAFRTAALFYYPLFFIFGYMFYNRNFFTQRTIYFLAILFLYLQTCAVIWGYFRMEYLILSIVVGLHVQNRKIKYAYFLLLAFVFPYKDFFGSSKSHLLGLITASLFLLFFLTYFFLTIRRRYRLWIFGAAFVIIISCMYFLGREEKVKVLLNFNPVRAINNYREVEASIAQRKAGFQFQDIPPQLYSAEPVSFSNKLSNLQLKKERKDAEPTFFVFREDLLKSGIVNIKWRLEKNFENSLSKKDLSADVRSSSISRYHESVERIFSSLESDIKQITEKIRAAAVERDSFTEADFSELYHSVETVLEETVSDAAAEANNILSELGIIPDPLLADLNAPGGHRVYNLQDSLSRLFGGGQSKLELLQTTELQSLVYLENKDIAISREYSNILFRVHIWRDMVEEIIENKAWMGMNFGKPQRSKRIEILEAARGEWSRDGWITPHNSFLHIVYRGGIFGVLWLVTLAFIIVRMIKGFIAMKSVVGILLSSILIYWLTVANFGVILEFPYNAIPFWSLFGMIYAYRHQLKSKSVYENSSHAYRLPR